MPLRVRGGDERGAARRTLAVRVAGSAVRRRGLNVGHRDWHGRVVDDEENPRVGAQCFHRLLQQRLAREPLNEVSEREDRVVVELHDVGALAHRRVDALPLTHLFLLVQLRREQAQSVSELRAGVEAEQEPRERVVAAVQPEKHFVALVFGCRAVLRNVLEQRPRPPIRRGLVHQRFHVGFELLGNGVELLVVLQVRQRVLDDDLRHGALDPVADVELLVALQRVAVLPLLRRPHDPVHQQGRVAQLHQHFGVRLDVLLEERLQMLLQRVARQERRVVVLVVDRAPGPDRRENVAVGVPHAAVGKRRDVYAHGHVHSLLRREPLHELVHRRTRALGRGHARGHGIYQDRRPVRSTTMCRSIPGRVLCSLGLFILITVSRKNYPNHRYLHRHQLFVYQSRLLFLLNLPFVRRSK